jgi:uncharacterized membrane protein (UPF0127 family)
MRWLSVSLLMVTACAGSPATSTTTTTPTATSTTSTNTVASTTIDPSAVVPEGFGLIAARATKADGTICELCLWLAETEDQRSKGLMFVTDLGGADGMVFVYPEPHSGSFWMKNTVTALSIAFFDAAGTFLDAFDMEPCIADPCPLYPTPSDFTFAVEVSQDGLTEAGFESGSVFELRGTPCPVT